MLYLPSSISLVNFFLWDNSSKPGNALEAVKKIGADRRCGFPPSPLAPLPVGARGKYILDLTPSPPSGERVAERPGEGVHQEFFHTFLVTGGR